MAYTNLLFSGVVISFVIYVLLTLSFDKLSKIPGPFLARFTNLWALIQGWRFRRPGGKEYEIAQHEAMRLRYGDVVRRGPRTVVVYDPSAVPLIYGIKSRFNKSDAYKPFRQSGVTTSLLSIPDEATHGKYRKLVANAYSMSSLKPYEPNVDQMVNRLIDVCNEHSKTNKPLDIGSWLYYFCFDNVSKITMGNDLGFMDGDGKDSFGLIKRVKNFGRYAGLVANMPWLHRIIQENPVLRKTRPSPFFQLMRSVVVDRIETQDTKSSARPDLLSHFVATHRAQPGVMDVKQAIISSSGNLIAGALSPGSTLNTLFQCMLEDPYTQDRLQAELAQHNIQVPSSFEDVKELPYLNGLLREALRLHPTSLSGLERVVSERGIVLPNGTSIPPGTKISCPSTAISRNTDVYGQDAARFNPERWLQHSDESLEEYKERRKLMDTSDLSFGQGSRTCIGKNVFMLEGLKVIASLFTLFKFEPISSSNASDLYVQVHRHGVIDL